MLEDEILIEILVLTGAKLDVGNGSFLPVAGPPSRPTLLMERLERLEEETRRMLMAEILLCSPPGPQRPARGPPVSSPLPDLYLFE